MKIYWERIIPYVLILCLSFLAARYLGTTYYVILRALTFLLVADIVLLGAAHFGLRYNQHFSNEHLIRGESIHYDFYLKQSLLTFSNKILIKFYSFQNPEMTDLSPMEFTLRVGERKDFNYIIQGGTRGIYKVGMSALSIDDFLGFFTINLPRQERTFYIHPRLYRGRSFFLKQVAGGGDGISKDNKGEGENVFSHLKEYRPGLPLRGISWKHFARYGYPLLREQEISIKPGRVLHMDRRSLQGNRQQEDGVLEATLALILQILEMDEAVLLEGITPHEPLEITNEVTFNSLYRATMSMEFNAPPLMGFRDASEGVTIISALPDWDLLDEAFWQNHEQWQLVAILEGMEERRKQKVLFTIKALRKKDVQITVIEKGEIFWNER